MNATDFIFSNRISYRLARHVGFWLIIFAWYDIGMASTGGEGESPASTSLMEFMNNLDIADFVDAAKSFPGEFIVIATYCYLLAYLFLPRYLLKGRYVMFTIWVVMLTLAGHALFLYGWGFNWEMPSHEMKVMLWYSLLRFVNLSPPIVCGLFIAIKLFKTWYLEEEQKQILDRENAIAELQLLKAQIHPHFLFNTLNNIYSFALSRSPRASQLVSRLTAILEYMTNNCDDSLVPVEKEIKMIKDYIELEKVRYGDRLRLEMHVDAKDSIDKLIPPFLLIVFVENSFKHGASEALYNPWVRLRLEVNDNRLCLNLANSKSDPESVAAQKKGIGLINVERRLKLLFPADANLLNVVNGDEVFEVTLEVPLTPAQEEQQQEVPERWRELSMDFTG
jgi:hypothetical protein